MSEELNCLPGDLPELTDDDLEALESMPDDAVSHWQRGEKWDFEKEIWIPAPYDTTNWRKENLRF